ncbi:AsnC family transcriptional regulator [Pseudonocardia acaciae]|uniref:AsnC family transcriptional regulator n=1 Tax=Pseudonocardia acaciae TaxID=551276 RepID=UPI000686FADB|nr:AsnC family transcriptional regulator [Pseudonocardia acaciae]
MAGRIRRSELDEVDRALVAALRQDGRASNVELARRVGISEKTVRARIARLAEEHGLTVTAELDDPRHRSRMVYLVETEPGQRFPVAESLADRPEVTRVHLVTGSADVLVAASFPDDAEALRFRARALDAHPGIRAAHPCHLIHEVGAPARGGRPAGPSVDTETLAALMIAPNPHGGFDELAERICDAVTDGLGADRAMITTARPGDRDRPAAPARRRGISEPYFEALTARIRDGRIEGVIKRVWDTRQHVLVADARVDPLMAAAHDLVVAEGYVTLLTLPMLYGPTLLATVSLYYDRPMSVGDEYVATAQGVIDHFAVGMARALGLAPSPFPDAQR